jgi:hypothetical protein
MKWSNINCYNHKIYSRVYDNVGCVKRWEELK